jgi:fructose 1,6-bisphosphate aldolase/phosphatase
MKKITISAIKADVGSIGGHTQPSRSMVNEAWMILKKLKDGGTIFDFDVTFTGDDLCLLMIHSGEDSGEIHDQAWGIFKEVTDIARKDGLYGAGQDLLVDAPSGNVRGAGPGVAEITFDMDAKERPAEPFLVFTADKCGPGAYNYPLWSVFTNPNFCMGLMLPKMKKGFAFKIIDMEHKGGEKSLLIPMHAWDDYINLSILVRDENKYGIQAIYSLNYPEQQVAAVSTDRLHTIAGVYKGKDDPVAIIRTQGIFPAPEEVVSPYSLAHYVAGGARGSHNMALMPVPIDTGVTGSYCVPIVACIAYSVNREGKLSERVDKFGNLAWNSVRERALNKSFEIRQQGIFGPAMLADDQLEYGEIMNIVREVDSRFTIS